MKNIIRLLVILGIALLIGVNPFIEFILKDTPKELYRGVYGLLIGLPIIVLATSLLSAALILHQDYKENSEHDK